MYDSGLNLSRRAVRRATLLWLCAAFFPVVAAADVDRLEMQPLEVEVDGARGQIVALADAESQLNFSIPALRSALWELELSGVEALTLSPAKAQRFRSDKMSGAERGLRLVWSDFGLIDAPGLKVEVTVLIDAGKPLSRWQLAVEALGQRRIDRIRFPRILGLPRLERERLAVPFWAGLLTPNPRQNFVSASSADVRREYEYPGLCSIQCLAFYSEGGPGLYLACDDTAGYRKAFAAFSQSGSPAPADGAANLKAVATSQTHELPDINLEIVHLPDRQEQTAHRYVLPYSAVVGTFRGDWFDAAAIYRTWATNQAWARESRWKRGLVPSWIADTGLWIWNRGRSAGVVEPAIAIQRELGLPVSLFWHWWHGCAYDTGFPEYLPPREGAASFASAVSRAHEHDVRALVYMNQRLWGMTTASWTNENAAAFAVKAADGLVKPEVYNTFSKLPCASMCMGSEFWRAKYSGLASEAFHGLGVDGIYMDQACSSLACFDPRHGHPPGGGAYWMSGFKALAADLRHRCATRGGIALAGEGCAENWLPHLDVMLALDVSRERYCEPDGWEPIPFFHAVYHGYAAFFGSYSSLTSPPYDDLWPAEFAPKNPLELLDRQFSRQFYLEQARAFVWGQQPTLANFQPSQFRERRTEIEYVMRLAKLRKPAVRYLQDGSMLPPPSVDAPTEEVPMSRLSIYAGQQGAPKGFQKRTPLVLASGWCDIDGQVAMAIASIADRPVTATVTLNAAKWGLREPGRFHVMGRDMVEPTVGGDGRLLVLKLTLSPLEARVLEWKSEP